MRVVVSGTGTGVGKTRAAVVLATALRAWGRTCVALKPIESGGDGDATALAAASSFHVKRPPPYRFDAPISPHLAARSTGVEIDATECARWVREVADGADCAIVELAGALLSPLSRTQTNVDLLRALAPDRWIAVAPDRLGVIHEVSALMLSCRCLDLEPPALVLDAPERPDGSTGTNAAEIEWLGIGSIAAELPRGSPNDPSSLAAASRLARHLRLL
jgi:dethiobiotin synthetase